MWYIFLYLSPCRVEKFFVLIRFVYLWEGFHILFTNSLFIIDTSRIYDKNKEIKAYVWLLTIEKVNINHMLQNWRPCKAVNSYDVSCVRRVKNQLIIISFTACCLSWFILTGIGWVSPCRVERCWSFISRVFRDIQEERVYWVLLASTWFGLYGGKEIQWFFNMFVG